MVSIIPETLSSVTISKENSLYIKFAGMQNAAFIKILAGLFAQIVWRFPSLIILIELNSFIADPPDKRISRNGLVQSQSSIAIFCATSDIHCYIILYNPGKTIKNSSHG